jgi:hypothetical protein
VLLFLGQKTKSFKRLQKNLAQIRQTPYNLSRCESIFARFNVVTENNKVRERVGNKAREHFYQLYLFEVGNVAVASERFCYWVREMFCFTAF